MPPKKEHGHPETRTPTGPKSGTSAKSFAQQGAFLTTANGTRLRDSDGQQLVGMVSQADVAKNLPDDNVADLVEAISKAPAN